MKKYDIVIVSGGFDPVHKGHVRMFKGAKELGHKVIAGANSDKWLVNRKNVFSVCENFLNSSVIKG